MAEEEPLARWERDLMEKRAAAAGEGRAAALRTGTAVLDAFDRGILHIDVRYLAETLRMVLNAMGEPDATPSDEDRIRDAMAEAQDHPGRVVTR